MLTSLIHPEFQFNWLTNNRFIRSQWETLHLLRILLFEYILFRDLVKYSDSLMKFPNGDNNFESSRISYCVFDIRRLVASQQVFNPKLKTVLESSCEVPVFLFRGSYLNNQTFQSAPQVLTQIDIQIRISDQPMLHILPRRSQSKALELRGIFRIKTFFNP